MDIKKSSKGGNFGIRWAKKWLNSLHNCILEINVIYRYLEHKLIFFKKRMIHLYIRTFNWIFVILFVGDNVHLKILVPSIAAGAIIGKGGETIAQVQKEAGARVKMSKANDFYPGTVQSVIIGVKDIHDISQVFVIFRDISGNIHLHPILYFQKMGGGGSVLE